MYGKLNLNTDTLHFWLFAYMCMLLLIIGREDWFRLHGRGRSEEAKQEQEIGEETCQKISRLFSF